MENPIIIGAGVSALVAAIELEKAGFSPIILEASNEIGGRVKTNDLNGLPIDHGFQVLLTEYPEAKHYLDYTKLDLIQFLPGSVIFKNGKMEKIGDPLRDTSFLWSTISAKIGSLKDKALILKLSLTLKRKSIDAIFAEPEMTTNDYLLNFGFSKEVIHNFFQPFFAGIYLEEDLATSSRMFEFVYKMFGTGFAAIPRVGMQAIPQQLASQLKKTEIRFQSPVSKIDEHTIILASGETFTSDKIIIATDPASFFDQKENTNVEWKSCVNLYFASTKPLLKGAIIGLLPGKENLVNNFHYVDAIFKPNDNSAESLLSVTVVKNNSLNEADLIKAVKTELKDLCGIDTGEMVKMYTINKALPNLNDLKYQPSDASVKLAPGIFCCGDYLANGSLNAAMASGRLAAREAIKG
jgi:protoporphyrinogen oxidase